MKSLYILCLLLLAGVGLHAQQITLTDEDTQSPIKGAVIHSATPEVTVITNDEGQADLSAMKGAQVIEISYSGYATLLRTYEELESAGFALTMGPAGLDLDQVTISATRWSQDQRTTASNVSIISNRTIQFQNPQTSGDMLAQSGEVFVQKSQMGGGSPVLRGFEANKVLMVVDGVRLNNAIYRAGHLQNVITIDPNMLERAEVMFGPGAVMYGSDALGGVMHFVTRDPAFATDKAVLVKGNAMARYSTANMEKTGHADLNIGLKQFASLTSFTYSDFGDQRAGEKFVGADTLFQRNWYVERINGVDSVIQNDDPALQIGTAYSQWDLMQKFKFVHKNVPLSHAVNFQMSSSSDIPRYDRMTESGGNGLPTFADWHYGPQKRMLVSYQANLGQLEGFGVWDQARLTLAYQDIEESRLNRRFNSSWIRARIENVQVMSANLDALKSLGGGRHQLSYGLDVQMNQVGSSAYSENVNDGTTEPLDTRYPDGGSTMRTMAAYVASRTELKDDKAYLGAGVRLTSVYLNSQFDDKTFFPFLNDDVTQNALAPSGSLGLVYLPSSSSKLSLQGATGFRAPNVDDIGKVFESSAGNVVVPNPDADPEYTYSLDLSAAKAFSDRVYLEGSLWATYYANVLAVRPSTFNGLDSVFYDGQMNRALAQTNVGEAWIRGASAKIRVNIIDGLSFHHTSTLTMGTLIDDSLAALDSTVYLDHIPPFYGRTGLRYEYKKFAAEVYVLYNGMKKIAQYSPSGEDNAQYATPDGMPAWQTLNLKLSYAFTDQIRLQVGAENLLDQHYRVFASGVSAPGRNIIVTLRAGF
jgi:hemoglobin/transferrin/lactoferrin receptor protein